MRLHRCFLVLVRLSRRVHNRSSDLCVSQGIIAGLPVKMGKLTEVSSNKTYGGYQKVFSHESTVLKCTMKFGIYIPPTSDADAQLPVLYWLSGLTCTEQNFITKAGAQRYASDLGMIIVNPDTSPRGCNIPGEDDSYDFGSGAGFYVNATEAPWKENYNMYDYVTKELPALINENFKADPERMSIFGHSMGGHGALICALKNPGLYRSVSAFSPICNPTNCDWGKKAFSGYLGKNTDAWKAYDATCLLASYDGPQYDVLIDQGKEDEFLKQNQLQPEKFVEACGDGKMPLILRMQEGYDHSYYFIQSFMEDHLKHHAKFLK